MAKNYNTLFCKFEKRFKNDLGMRILAVAEYFVGFEFGQALNKFAIFI